MTSKPLSNEELVELAAHVKEAEEAFARLAEEISRLKVPEIPSTTVSDVMILLARVSTLEAALAALVGPGAVGYHDWFPDQKNRDGCTYCSYEWEADQPERHASDCPVAIAQHALKGNS